ncbi:iron ABC transporter substrate-binding protein [Weissella confusa]|uniref:ABC transporter substrate-binding protein n=1 Tax=Weissella confusa TaxID=1583 RepID=UPI0010922616|nr:ABC transporter substrate-binding protein [Weissella confusa]MBJ7693565.1 ABC transporter substrate-binding protein [Weissella confusa]QBZ03667.1 iron ABC transporter substrate-binding protein [Weissella confusa]
MSKKQLTGLGILFVILVIITGGWIWLATQKNTNTASSPTKRIIVTTNAQAQVFDQLAIPLVGVPTPGEQQTLPKRYAKLPQVGNHVAPNLEKMSSLNPDVVYLDSALVDDYQQKLDSDHIASQTLDFSTLDTLKSSITTVGKQYNKQSEANKLVKQLTITPVKPASRPKVALLMGMPGGSFLVGTQHSYVGDLINKAGGDVIGAGDSAYTNLNAEQIAAENPDVIVTMAHAMPDNVFKSFDALFAQNNWQTINAVKNGHVYQAKEPIFGMTANLNAIKAFNQIKTWLGN